MLNTIMVPLDGSALAESALSTAYALARRDSARVELVMVREPPLSITRVGSAPVMDPTIDTERHEEDRRYLDVLLGRIPAADRARTHSSLLDGPVVGTLAARIREVHASLVVMTTHARGGIARATLGSVADALVRRSPAPVLLLHPSHSGEARSNGFRRVLLPLDGSAAGESMIERAIEVAGTDGVEYTLLRVLSARETSGRRLLPQRGEEGGSRSQRATIESVLDNEAAKFREWGVAVRSQTVVHDGAAEGIIQYAAGSGTDLIAMNTRSRGGLERMVLGSVADAVLRGWRRPLLLLNQRGA